VRLPLAFGLGLLVLLLVAPAFSPHDPVLQSLSGRLAPPSFEHPLGCDHLGRDVLTRLLYGVRYSLGFTALAVVACSLAGTFLGLLAGRLGGVFSELVMRTVDALVPVPTVLVGLVLAAVLEPGVGTLLLAVVLVGWAPFARLGHALSLKIGVREYVAAAVVLGAGEVRILLRHVLPNAAGPILAYACLQFAHVLLTIGGLSFLGLGAQPPTPEWGAMLAEARPYMERAPLLTLAPGLTIVATALGVTALGRRLEARWALPRT
jgi:peptide/nickel transport system permease protein